MKFCRNDDVISRREGKRTLVLHPQTGRLCILNSTSTFLWEHCTGEWTPQELTELLATRFEIPEAYAEPTQLLNLVTGHLNVLQKAQLLEVATA